MFGKGGGKLWCGQGTGDRGGTLFSPQALKLAKPFFNNLGQGSICINPPKPTYSLL